MAIGRYFISISSAYLNLFLYVLKQRRTTRLDMPAGEHGLKIGGMVRQFNREFMHNLLLRRRFAINTATTTTGGAAAAAAAGHDMIYNRRRKRFVL